MTENGEEVMSLGQYFDVIEKRLTLSRGENSVYTDSIRSRGRKVMEEKAKSDIGQGLKLLKQKLSGTVWAEWSWFGISENRMQ